MAPADIADLPTGRQVYAEIISIISGKKSHIINNTTPVSGL